MAERQNSITETAMNRVLEAERTAHAAMKECEAQAAALLETTQQQVRRIHSRTDTRLGKLHARCALALDRQVEELLLQDIGSGDDENRGDAARGEVLQEAIDRLAEVLTSGNGDE